ncbi:cupredoxin domain-containing protein [Rhodococcus koreensis]
MTENPGTRTLVKVGDKVTVHAEGTSVFTIVSIDGDAALIESIASTPGTYPFYCKLERLVPVES